MKSEEHITFDESSWWIIEAILPDNENVKIAVLNDFMWFMGREKYKSNIQKIGDYVHHLQLKQKMKIGRALKINSTIFIKIDIESINERLQLEYGRY